MRTGWGAKVMPNTFEIRFARSAGIAAILVLCLGALLPSANAAPASSSTAVVPFANAAAKKQLAVFEAETAKLRAEFTKVRNSPKPEPIVALEQQWWRLTERIYTSPEFNDPAIRSMLHAELAASRSWRMALSAYAQGVRTADKKLITGALAEIEFAEALAARVRLYVR